MKREKKLSGIIAEGIRDLFYIWREELKAIFKDSGVMIFFLLGSISLSADLFADLSSRNGT